MTSATSEYAFNADYRLKLVLPKTKDWRDFHEIVRTALFEQSAAEYDIGHVDSYLPRPCKRTPLLLTFQNKSLGTVVVDDLGDGRGVMRLVAIANEHQGEGHGRALLALVSVMALTLGIRELCVNSDSAKTAFYRSAGFAEHEWGPEELEDCRTGRAWPMPAQMHLKLR